MMKNQRPGTLICMTLTPGDLVLLLTEVHMMLTDANWVYVSSGDTLA